MSQFILWGELLRAEMWPPVHGRNSSDLGNAKQRFFKTEVHLSQPSVTRPAVPNPLATRIQREIGNPAIARPLKLSNYLSSFAFNIAQAQVSTLLNRRYGWLMIWSFLITLKGRISSWTPSVVAAMAHSHPLQALGCKSRLLLLGNCY